MEGVGAGSGIYKTTDGGATWTRLTDPALGNGLPTDRMGRIGLAVSPQDPSVVYAMIQVDRRLRREFPEARMNIQVHDELVFDVPESQAEAIGALVCEVMEHAVELKVPIKVDWGVGHNWLECK